MNIKSLTYFLKFSYFLTFTCFDNNHPAASPNPSHLVSSIPFHFIKILLFPELLQEILLNLKYFRNSISGSHQSATIKFL